MAGGQRIDDHANWTGAKPAGEVFAHGPHKVKSYNSDGHVGELHNYEDTNEEIQSQQRMAEKKQKGHDRRPLHRN